MKAGPAGFPAWLKWGLWIVLGVVGLAAVLLAWKRQDLREWRARGLAAESREALMQGDFKKAQFQAMAAFQISPANPEVLRASAELNARTGHPQTLAFYSALLATGQATAADRIGFIEAALRAGEFDQAKAEMDKGGWTPAEAGRLRELRAALAFALGDLAGAEVEWRERVAMEPDAPGPRIELARLLLVSGDATAIAEAVEILEGLSANHPVAAKLLLEPMVPKAARLAAAERGLADPAISAEDRLTAAAIVIEADPARRAELLAALAGQYPTSDPVRFRNFCAWLVQIGEARTALDRLPLSLALTRKDYFLVWLDGQASLGRWAEIQSVLGSRNPPLEPALVALFLGRVAGELGEPDAARYSEKAIAAANRNPEMLLYLAAYFHRSGQWKPAERALRLLTLDPATAMPAYQSLLNLYRDRGDTPAVLATLQEMSVRWPANAAVQNDRRYVELLRGTRPAETLLAESRAAFEKEPGEFPFRMTYALALLKAGRSTEALTLFQDSAVKIRQLLPWQKAILAAILRSEGMTEGAAAVEAQISADSLSAEERALLPAAP